MFGQHRQVGVVADGDRQLGCGALHQLAERGVVPAEVGSQPDDVSEPVDGAGNADSDSDRVGAGAHDLLQRRHSYSNLVSEFFGLDRRGIGGDDLPGKYAPADPDGGSNHAVDVDVHGHGKGAVGPRTDDVGGPSHAWPTARNRLIDEPQSRQLCHQITDRRAAQPQALRELRPGQLAVEVDLLKDECEVVTPHGVLPHRRGSDQLPLSVTETLRISSWAVRGVAREHRRQRQ